MSTSETPPELKPCRVCRGLGGFADIRTAAITHRATTVKRKCRNCQGAGTLVVPALVPVWDTEVGPIPDWMLE